MSRDHHGPSAREQQVLDLWERDIAAADIAHQLDLKVDYVRRVVTMLGAPKGDDWHRSTRLASQTLLRALRRHHPERCGRIA